MILNLIFLQYCLPDWSGSTLLAFSTSNLDLSLLMVKNTTCIVYKFYHDCNNFVVLSGLFSVLTVCFDYLVLLLINQP